MSLARLLLLVMFLPEIMSLAQNSADDYTEKLIGFNKSYGRYFREYFGCPKESTIVEECKGSEFGKRDWKLEEDVIKKAEIFTK